MSRPTTPRSAVFSPTLLAVLALIAGTVVFACALTPTVQSTIRAIADRDPWPFSRVFDRVALAGAILMAWLLRRRLRLGELFAGRAGWRKPRVLRTVAIAAVISMVTALASLPLVVNAGKGVWNDRSATEFLLRTLEVAPAALLISLIEESFFRGLLFQRLITEIGLWGAVIASSFLYALAHVTASNREWVYEGWSVLAGFRYFGAVFEQAWSPGVGLALIGLFGVGCTLCMTLRRSGGLAACIGLHSGWVLSVKVGRFLMRENVDVPLPPGARRYYLLTQPVVWLSIVLVAILAWFLFRRPAASEGEP